MEQQEGKFQIQITISGKYSDGQPFRYSTDSIERAIGEFEMIEVNEHVYDKPENPQP